MSSDNAINLYALVKTGIVKSNAHFWREFSKEKIENFVNDLTFYKKELKEQNINVVCVYDHIFPKLDLKMKNSERPFLFAYKGNIDLLHNTNNNISVIGVLTPNEEIKIRQQKIVTALTKNNLTIVSGLARGCDTIAHTSCLSSGGKTIAILSTTFNNIYPKENTELVDQIIQNGGLVITEYINEPKNKFERIERLIERDRLQAMLSKAVLLIASFRQGEGDSGSRHAMQKAKDYGKKRFVMFDPKTDSNQKIFGLNQDMIDDDAKILTKKSIRELIN